MNCGFKPPTEKRELPLVTDMEGVFDVLIFLVKDVYKAPVWIQQLMLSARILLKETVENYLDYHIDYKLDQVTQEHRLVGLIYLLRDVLFFDDDPPRTEEDKMKRYNEVLKELIDFLPSVFVSALGSDRTKIGSEHLLQIFQQPKLNKQLSYILLDIVVLELFPELIQPNSFKGNT
uniref:Sorting nexin C-terminal domain-containing protein n=1 Tax=Arion vulgaris TaxID=1028688 RepID=A0A0B6YIW7_9EUPU